MTVKKDKGFTLPETLVVIAIILILSATVGFSAFKFVGKAKTTACKNQIEIFKIALQAYYLDCGAYPSGGQGLQALWEKPILAPIPANWNGPYLDREIPSDPWNNQYEQDKQDAIASLRHVGTISNPNNPGHWQEGYKNGNFRYDPISGNSDGGRKNFPNKTRYVVIRQKE